VFAGKPESKIHELISAKIILENPELREHLSDRERQNIVGLWMAVFGDSYLHEIVSGPIDADKQDYLLKTAISQGSSMGFMTKNDSRTPYGSTKTTMIWFSQSQSTAFMRWSNSFLRSIT